MTGPNRRAEKVTIKPEVDELTHLWDHRGLAFGNSEDYDKLTDGVWVARAGQRPWSCKALNGSPPMSGYRFELAAPEDDVDLRHVLAMTPMEGRISVSFRREPSWFAAAVVDGWFRQVVACRDLATGRIFGFGCRSVRDLYVNGRLEAVGYLSSLRVLPEYRNRGLVARGYAFFRELHLDGRARLYLTTIAAGNSTALKVLTSGRAGLPAYHPAGLYHTVALPLRRRKPAARPADTTIRPARPEDLPALLAFLQEVGPGRQFFPHYRAQDFLSPEGTLRDLRLDWLFLAERRGRIVGTLAGWDQHGFRQSVVDDYSTWVGWARPLSNIWSWMRGRPGLPAPGSMLRYLTASLPLVSGDDPQVFAALLEALLARSAGGPWTHLLVGLHQTDPLLAVARRDQAQCYTTHLYLVCWEDGEEQRSALDGRPMYLELGSL